MLYYIQTMTANVSGTPVPDPEGVPEPRTVNLRGPNAVHMVAAGNDAQADLRTNVLGRMHSVLDASDATTMTTPETPWRDELLRLQRRLQAAGLDLIPECNSLFEEAIADREEFDRRAGAALDGCRLRYGLDNAMINALGHTLAGLNTERVRFCVPTENGVAVIQRLIGRGGFGEVYAAVDRDRPTRAHAVKTIRMPRAQADVNAVLTSIERERAALRETGDLQGGTDDVDASHIVMRYERGPSLEKMMALNGGKLPIRLAVRVVRQAAQRLNAIRHLHLDVKPANLLVNVDLVDDQPDVRVHVIDWGAAQLPGEDNMGIATPAYAPPEQLVAPGVRPETPGGTVMMGSDITSLGKYSDVYALTVTLYKMLTGNTIVDEAPVSRPVTAEKEFERIQRLKHDARTAGELGIINVDRRSREGGRHPAADPTLLEQATLVPRRFCDGGQKVREAIARGLERRHDRRVSLEEYIELLEQAEALLGTTEPYRSNILKLQPMPRLQHGGPARTGETDDAYHARVAKALTAHFEFTPAERR